jgi:predicted amidophosphoribosyltransferase
LWVGREICQVLVARGLGKEVHPYVERANAVPKSAFALPADRPKPSTHYASFVVTRSLFPPRSITLVDDVITKGATLIAAASCISSAFPDCEVRAFALIRTMSQQEVNSILDPCLGTITFNSARDSTHREP